jgi:hypothetical protein
MNAWCSFPSQVKRHFAGVAIREVDLRSCTGRFCVAMSFPCYLESELAGKKFTNTDQKSVLAGQLRENWPYLEPRL